MVEQAKVKGKDDDEADHFALCFLLCSFEEDV